MKILFVTTQRIETRTAPSAWASYLINGDASSLDEQDIVDCDHWMALEKLGIPVSCEDAGFMKYHDAFHVIKVSADCQEYTFLI